MADIKNINYNYYGSKEEWRAPYPNYDPSLKTGKYGNLVAYYTSGKLSANGKLDESIKMFGFSSEKCDKLYANVIYIDPETNTYVHVKEKHENGGVYYTLRNSVEVYDTIYWSKDLTTSISQDVIYGYGLERFYNNTINETLSPIVDFSYNHQCALIKLFVLEYSLENDVYNITRGPYSIALDDYFNNIPENSCIVGYYFDVYWGATNRNYTQFLVTNDMDFPIGKKSGQGGYDFPIFNISNRYLLFSGGGVHYGLGITPLTTSNIYFNGNPKNFEIKKFVSDRGRYQSFYPVFKPEKEYFLTQACFTGLYFTGDLSTAQRATLGKNMTDEKVYTPIITDGIITGEYVTGSKGAEQPSADWTDDIREKTGFTGVDNIDPTKYTDLIKLNKPKLKTAGAFNTFYAMNEKQLKSLANNLWTADDTKFQEILQGLKLMGENPMNAIISLNLFPFSIPPLAETAIEEEIKIGRVLMGCNGTKVKNIDSVIDLGSIKLRNYFDNFLNYEPYSTAFLYIPYCNTIQISLNDFIGKTISIKLIVDYMTGACTAVVFADGIPIVYKNGVIAQSISVTGTDSATTASNVINSTLNQITNFSSFTAGSLSGNVSGIVTSGANILGKTLDYSAERTIYQSQGASSSGIESYLPQKPYFVINLPKYNIDSSFGQYHGYKTDFYSFINELTGYVETDTPILSNILCTDDEKSEIQNLLMSGVYV